MLAFKIIVNLLILLMVLSHYEITEGSSQEMKLEQQLHDDNPSMETLDIKEGGDFDCIDIYKQPTFKHPLLKDHKIQTRPTSAPKGFTSTEPSSTEESSIIMPKEANCPLGTVPIRRTPKEDLIKAQQYTKTIANNLHPHTTDVPYQHLAIVKPKQDEEEVTTFRGVMSKISVWSLNIKNDQYSAAQMWVVNGPMTDHRLSLQAGWLVAPGLMHDNLTHLFTYWTTDNSKTGCFNTLCPGFVQVDRQIAVGAEMSPLSTYGQRTFHISLAILQDKATGNWWLSFEAKNGAILHLGYWPKEILPSLDGGASFVAWGGLTIGSAYGNPPMGNGHKPEDDFLKTCYFKELKVIDPAYEDISMVEADYDTYIDNEDCYGIHYYGRLVGRGISFLFGGPGGMCGM